MKIYELAKELNIENKVLMEYLKKEGVEVKSHMSNVPDKVLGRVKDKFAKKEKVEPGAVKAVALPEHIMKKVEEDARAREKSAAEKAAQEAKQSRPQQTAGNAAKKKKKIVGVFNPQYSSSLKGKSTPSGNAPGEKVQEKPPVKRPLPSQIRPARDRKPDDYVEPVRQEIPAAEPVIPEKTEQVAAPAEPAAVQKPAEVKVQPPVQEKKTEEPVIVPAAESAKEPEKEAKAADRAKEQPAAAAGTAGPSVKAEAAPVQEKKPENKSAKNSDNKNNDNRNADNKNQKKDKKDSRKVDPKAKARTQALIRAETSRPGESEAIKSLREKIVKGTINPDDLISTTSRAPKKSTDRKNAPASQASGKKFTNNRNTGFSKDKDAEAGNTNRQQTRSGKSSQNSQAAAAPVQDSRGKGKGGKPQKGKYEKNKGDKFDRLENEKAAQRMSKQPVKQEPEEDEIKVITIGDTIELKDFAAKLKMQPAALIKELFLKGKIFTLNDVLDFETAEEIALDKDIICEHEVEINYIEELLKEEDDPEETLKKRPPVVCIMGHVDHGKTSLLDAIRNTNVTAGEAGGITQHIGAYTVEINGESITFLDTPGHEAFTAMRLRGAQSTDVAILVVAADDGVMPQTIEAINHARAANIHVIVAVNKIDKPAANIDKVKQELADQGLIPEDWGGDTIFVPVSAKTGEGIENLLEMVIIDTEILELRANPDRKARGIVIEAKLDKGRGSVATLLVQKGTLKVGDHVAIGEAYGKVRAMTNDKGQKIKEAAPSTPVEITGLNGVPNAGEVFVAFDNDKDAKQFSQVYVAENKKKLLAGARNKMTLDDVFSQMKAGELKELDIVVKADVQGSVEAIRESLEKLSNDEIIVKCIHAGAGNVSESDAILASASNAIIIAFNVGVNPDAKDTIEREKVDLRTYSVIYNAIDDVELAMKGMLEPVYEEAVIGHVEVRQTFKASGIGIIAGSYVTDGVVKRQAKVRLSRDGEQLFDGAIASLKRFNDDAKEVRSGFECGIVLKDFQDIKEGDIMEVYEMREVPRA